MQPSVDEFQAVVWWNAAGKKLYLVYQMAIHHLHDEAEVWKNDFG